MIFFLSLFQLSPLFASRFYKYLFIILCSRAADRIEAAARKKRRRRRSESAEALLILSFYSIIVWDPSTFFLFLFLFSAIRSHSCSLGCTDLATFLASACLLLCFVSDSIWKLHDIWITCISWILKNSFLQINSKLEFFFFKIARSPGQRILIWA